jgi:hypothetical protein
MLVKEGFWSCIHDRNGRYLRCDAAVSSLWTALFGSSFLARTTFVRFLLLLVLVVLVRSYVAQAKLHASAWNTNLDPVVRRTRQIFRSQRRPAALPSYPLRRIIHQRGGDECDCETINAMNAFNEPMRSVFLLLIANWAFRDDHVISAFRFAHYSLPTFLVPRPKNYWRVQDPYLVPPPLIAAFNEASRCPRGAAFRPSMSVVFLSAQDLVSQAQDLETLQSLFNTYCDPDGLMTKDDVRKIPLIADLLVR